MSPSATDQALIDKCFQTVFPSSDEMYTTVILSNIIENSLAHCSLIIKHWKSSKIGCVVCGIFSQSGCSRTKSLQGNSFSIMLTSDNIFVS